MWCLVFQVKHNSSLPGYLGDKPSFQITVFSISLELMQMIFSM